MKHGETIIKDGWCQIAGMRAVKKKRTFIVYYPWWRKLFKIKPILKEI